MTRHGRARRVRPACRAGGFTLIELLVTVLIIGILAGIGMAAYTKQRRNAWVARNVEELAVLERAIFAARANEDKTLREITGTGWTGGGCDRADLSGVFPGDVPQTDLCWTRYLAAITAIEQASGMSLPQLREGDVSGAPYYINENEGEAGWCLPDGIGFFTGGGKVQGVNQTNTGLLKGWLSWTNGAYATPQPTAYRYISRLNLPGC